MSDSPLPESSGPLPGKGPPLTKEFLDTVPHHPGVYLMKDGSGTILYVGKAADLRKRLASYAGTAGERSAKTAMLVKRVRTVETIITNTENEALILEAALIKKHRPKYNVTLRDDKNYPMLKVTVGEKWPRLVMARRRTRDGARYFGPYSSAGAMWQTLNLLRQVFPLRRCRSRKFARRIRPCLNHQMGLCPAPCAGKADHDRYIETVREVLMVLEGKNRELIRRLEEKMQQAAAALDFEEAAVCRDRIAALADTLEKQVVAADHFRDQDVFGYEQRDGNVAVSIMNVRQGRVSGHQAFYLTGPVGGDSEILAEAVKRYYGGGNPVPDDIVLPFAVDEMDPLAGWLGDLRQRKTDFRIPKRGNLVKLLGLARANAMQVHEQQRKNDDSWEKLAAGLVSVLHLKAVPERIECYDISTIGGEQAVGSRVAFLRGEPDKSSYRCYKIRSVRGMDDYGMLAEVISRRFRDETRGDLPDLLLVDGGKGQLNVVLRTVAECGLEGRFAVIGIAKERNRGDAGEKIYLRGRKNPLKLPKHSPVLLLFMRIRDEAHRFGIAFHRKWRRQETLRSGLDDIPGVGPARRRALLEKLGSLQAVRNAAREELAAVPGIGNELAGQIWDYFHSE